MVLVPLVMHAAPASAAGATNLRMQMTASPNTWLGLEIFANVNLFGSSATPSGTMTFRAFGPQDPNCTSAMFTSTVAVAGTSVNSAHFTPAHAGTYHWMATYSGDALYAAAGPTACTDAGAAVIVTKASPVVAVAAAPSTPVAVHGTATLTGGAAPTGTISFMLTGPNDTFCSTTPVFTSTVAVNGAGSYDSGLFAPARSGKYTWQAVYNGDGDNMSTTISPCLDTAASQTVTARPPAGDFNGSGKTQLSLFRPNTGIWYIQNAVGGTINSLQWGQTDDVPVPGDYNGDGKTDIAVFRSSNGAWYVKGIIDVAWGISGDIPVPGDYNGDGKTDIAVFRPSTGQWLVKGIIDVAYGTSGDIPVPGDYNGDGRTDIAVFRPSTGAWYVKGISEAVYGTSGDIPVPSDYNGDGKTDMAVFRPSTGTWYVRGMFEKVLGQAGDMPQPGDYDGDGKTDPTVYRPDPGTWFLSQTTAGAAQSTLGVVGDVVTSLVGVVWSLTGLLGH